MFSPNTTQLNRRLFYGISEVKEVKSPGKYLGVPMAMGRNRTTGFKALSYSIDPKLHGWTNKLLFKKGQIFC